MYVIFAGVEQMAVKKKKCKNNLRRSPTAKGFLVMNVKEYGVYYFDISGVLRLC